MKTKMREQVFQHAVLHDGAEDVDEIRKSRAGEYVAGRVRMDLDGTSRLSPYLAAGLVSCRAALRATMQHGRTKRLNTDHRSGAGPPMWVSEVAWKDFYQHVLAAFPRVCRGLPYSIKYRDIVWEQNEEHLQRWKDGRTGVPIVDASMRSLKEQGWMHNRGRMIVAMYLTKNMMINWQHGERWFMHQLIDGDFGSNNGGWQWSVSGVARVPAVCCPADPTRLPCPCSHRPARTLSRTSASSTLSRRPRRPTPTAPSSATGSQRSPTSRAKVSSIPPCHHRPYCRRHMKLTRLQPFSLSLCAALYEPSTVMPSAELEKIGYCSPVVDYKASRQRCLARYKNPGDDGDE